MVEIVHELGRRHHSMRDYAKPKAFVLLFDDSIYHIVRSGLEDVGFEVEGLLSQVATCHLIVVDHATFQLNIAKYLRERNIYKPSILLLNDMQTLSGPVQAQNYFHDIWVIRDREISERGVVISALEGERELKILLRKYLPEFQPVTESQLKSASESARAYGAA